MKPLCYAPFVNLHWKGSRNDAARVGRARPCCDSLSNENATDFKEKPTLDQIWNNPKINEIRETLLRGEWHESCKLCKEKEIKNGFSGRASYERDVEKYGLTIDGGIQMLDYRPSNLCNLKCRMCEPYHSSLLAEEQNDVLNIYDKNTEKDFLIETLDWSKLKRVKLLGGEPMIMPETLDVLEKVTEECTLQITTNAFKISPSIEKKILDCKAKIHFNLSIDAVGDTYDYIRVGSDWNKVKDNVSRLLDYNRFEISVNPVIMMWNVFNLEELWDWTESVGVIAENAHWVGQRWNRAGLLTTEHKSELIGIHPRLDSAIQEKFFDRDLLIDQWKKETKRNDELRGTDIRDLDERYAEYL